MSRPVRVLAIVLVVIGLLGGAHVLRAGLSESYSAGRENAHVRSLARALDGGAGAEMQRLFPEGEFFSWTLTGLAAGRLAADGTQPDENMAVVLAALAATGRPDVASRFGVGHRGVPHGAFYHGWRLLLGVQQASVSGEQGHLDAVHAEATALLAALDDLEPLTSYPDQAWPCDLVVAWAAVHQADALRPVAGLDAATQRLLGRIDEWRDPATGLIGHQFRPDGTVSGARGSSQAIINSYLRQIDPALADAEWAGFTARFVQASYGLVGVREHPAGQDGSGDVDSGPLIDGISLSASAVSLGAARANGDHELADLLSDQAELLGLPLPWPGDQWVDGRAFALGLMPVGDAFVVDARTQPLASTTLSLNPDYPGIWWPVWFLVALFPALIGVLLLSRRPRTSGR